MWKQFYAGSELLDLPLLSMALFALTFAAAVYLAGRIRADDPRGRLPLEDDGPGDGGSR